MNFLDDRLFPEHANPGVIVQPGGSGAQPPLLRAVFSALPVMSRRPELWRGKKMIVGENLEVLIRSRDFKTSAVTTKKYVLRPQKESALMWVDE